MKQQLSLAAAAVLAFSPLPALAVQAAAKPETAQKAPAPRATPAQRAAFGICMTLQMRANRICTPGEFREITRLAQWDHDTFFVSPQARVFEFNARLNQILNPPKVKGMQKAGFVPAAEAAEKPASVKSAVRVTPI